MEGREIERGQTLSNITVFEPGDNHWTPDTKTIFKLTTDLRGPQFEGRELDELPNVSRDHAWEGKEKGATSKRHASTSSHFIHVYHSLEPMIHWTPRPKDLPLNFPGL